MNEPKKIAYISEIDFKGSGYSAITINLCQGLANLGCDVKVIALSYKNEEHYWPFSILPAENINEAIATFHNLMHVWSPDVAIVALDIPLQEHLLSRFQQYPVPYIAITPLESDPLCLPWAMILMQAKKVFFLSEFGAREAQKVGVPAEHIRLGIDSTSWKPPTPEEKKLLRGKILGVENDETFVVLQVADNQERKNLSAAFEIMGKFKETVTEDFRYILVTRSGLNIGWKLRQMAQDCGFSAQYMEFERGMPFRELWSLYACADVFMLSSKGEGYGFPVVEAMACGLPVVTSETGALIEHVTQGGGWLIPPKFVHTDPYGNARRYYIDVDAGADALAAVHAGLDVENAKQRARAYAESLTWDIPVNQLYEAIREVTRDEKQLQPASVV